ncbi:hypothetical protein QBC44DRAFT_361601 [Cladorrhinum sp. PSN332]|nr:hypothetical protein QBC44DRAFT_361601 [Cladorrhinum sp. PSN332]
MELLPVEVIIKIASHLPRAVSDEDARLVRPGIASISRKWQSVVEEHTFRKLKITNTELPKFASIFSAPQSHRRALLKSLNFSIILPTYTDQECGIFETNEDRAANDKFASEAVYGLFTILSSWGPDPAIGLSLSFDIHSPMDCEHRGYPKYRQDSRDAKYGNRQDLFGKRYKYSYIRLTHPDKSLPEVPCIAGTLEFWKAFEGADDQRNVHPCSQAALALTKAPRVQNLVWGYREPGVYLPLRRAMRQEFVQYLDTLRLGPFINAFEFELRSRWYLHYHRLPNLVFPHEQDPLPSALHRLIASAENLRSVTYKGQADASLFWPYPAGQEPSQPLWPSVTDLSVKFDYRAPNGQWYLQARPPGYWADSDDLNNEDYPDEPVVDRHDGDEPLPFDTASHMPPGYGSAQETRDAVSYEISLQKYTSMDGTHNGAHDFRTWPNDATILPLLAAFARAIAHMPSLKFADLSTPLERSGDGSSAGEWSVFYSAPGSHSGYDKYMKGGPNLSAPRVFFHVEDWRPSKKVLDLFREVGRKYHGQETVITFMPWQYYIW